MLVLLAAISAVILRNVFVAAHRAIGWTIAAALLAVLLVPVVHRLQRHMPRILALVITLVGFALLAGVLWAGTRHQIILGIKEIKVEAPKAAATFESKYGWAKDADVVARVNNLVSRISTPSTTSEVTNIVGTTTSYFVPGILTLFLMVYGAKMVAGALGQIAEPRRSVITDMVQRSADLGRLQILLAVAQAFAVGLVVWTVCTIMGLPAAFLLALTAGLFGILPAMGIVLGGLPAIFMAVALHGEGAGLAMAAVILGLQLVEALVARPWIRRRGGDVGPALILVIVLLAFELYGIGGATYAYISLVFAMAFVHQLALRGDAINALEVPS
jgi:predicted PurR-regulated permease PerM